MSNVLPALLLSISPCTLLRFPMVSVPTRPIFDTSCFSPSIFYRPIMLKGHHPFLSMQKIMPVHELADIIYFYRFSFVDSALGHSQSYHHWSRYPELHLRSRFDQRPCSHRRQSRAPRCLLPASSVPHCGSRTDPQRTPGLSAQLRLRSDQQLEHPRHRSTLFRQHRTSSCKWNTDFRPRLAWVHVLQEGWRHQSTR